MTSPLSVRTSSRMVDREQLCLLVALPGGGSGMILQANFLRVALWVASRTLEKPAGGSSGHAQSLLPSDWRASSGCMRRSRAVPQTAPHLLGRAPSPGDRPPLDRRRSVVWCCCPFCSHGRAQGHRAAWVRLM